MKLVQRGNKQLRVADDRVSDMLAAGYVEVNSRTGKPVAVPEAADSNAALKRENSAMKKENKDLKSQTEALKKENEDLKSQIEVLTVQINVQNGNAGNL